MLTLAGLSACGGSKSATPDRVIEIDMANTAFSPTSLDVRAGELVEFRFHNRDNVTHDAFIGTEKEQRAHEKSMAEDDAMHHHGMSGARAVTVKAGASGVLRRTFAGGDQGILIGCHEPGHYRAGMRLAVRVGK